MSPRSRSGSSRGTSPSRSPPGPPIALARTEREMWVASGRSGRLDLDAERGTLKTAWTLGETGPALAPIQVAGSLQVLTQQDTEGAGRRPLGRRSPVRVGPLADRAGIALDRVSRGLSRGRGARHAHGRGSIPDDPARPPRRGGLRRGPLARGRARSGSRPGPSIGSRSTGSPSSSPRRRPSTCWSARGRANSARSSSPPRSAHLPSSGGGTCSSPAAMAAPTGSIPARASRGPSPSCPTTTATSRPAGSPPRSLDDDAVVLADDTGRVRRLTRPTDPRPRLVVSAEVNLDKGLRAAPVATGGAVILATGDGQVRALAARDLSPLGAWPLEAPLETPPSSVSDRAFVADARGTVLAIGRDGERLWSIDLKEAVVGPPAVLGDSVYFLTRAGSLHRRQLADGSPLGRIPLGVSPPAGSGSSAPTSSCPSPSAPSARSPRRRGKSRSPETPFGLSSPHVSTLSRSLACSPMEVFPRIREPLAGSPGRPARSPRLGATARDGGGPAGRAGRGMEWAPEGNAQDATGVPAGKDLLKTAPFDRITLDRRERHQRRPDQPAAPAPSRDGQGKTGQAPGQGQDHRPPRGEHRPARGEVEGRDGRGGQGEGGGGRPGQRGHHPPARGRGPRLQGQAQSTSKQVEYFEDMLLAEARRLLLARDYARAFEAALRVQTRNPGWPGLDEVVNRILFEEGSAALLENDGERGLRLLRELHARRPDFPELADKLAAAYGDRIARAFAIGLVRAGPTRPARARRAGARSPGRPLGARTLHRQGARPRRGRRPRGRPRAAGRADRSGPRLARPGGGGSPVRRGVRRRADPRRGGDGPPPLARPLDPVVGR